MVTFGSIMAFLIGALMLRWGWEEVPSVRGNVVFAGGVLMLIAAPIAYGLWA